MAENPLVKRVSAVLAMTAVSALALAAVLFGAAPAQAAKPAQHHAAAPADSGDDSWLFNSDSPEPAPPSVDPSTGKAIPLSASDKLLLTKVRQADLWEIPTGQMAQQKASSPIVKQAGAVIAANHQALDKIVLQLGEQLNVTLPNSPNPTQQGYLNDLNNKSGAAFDAAFANHLRYAHGQVFDIIAQVRTATHNPIIRSFAQTANTVVMRHITLVESTGLVDYTQLPAAQISQAASTTSNKAPTFTNAYATASIPGGRGAVIIAMLVAAGLIGFVSLRRVRRGM
jgi:predicted outer membrane protein